MIRRFAGGDVRLYELLKPSLAVSTKARTPRAILWRDDYYVDQVGDLDEELLKDIEQRFSRFYEGIISAPRSGVSVTGPAASALVDWCASMLARTAGFSALRDSVLRKLGGPMAELGPEAVICAKNAMLVSWYDEMRDVLSRPGWKWRMIIVGGTPGLVLTDNPVLLVRFSGVQHFHILAPLSATCLLIGGPGIPRELPHDLIPRLNLHFSAWSHSRIYSPALEQLRLIAAALGADTPWAQRARSPLCGLPEQIRDGGSPPADAPERFWSEFKSSLGLLDPEWTRVGRAMIDRRAPGEW